MTKKNILTHGKKAKADSLALENQLEQACALYAGVCKTDPMDVEAWVKLGVTQQRLGQYAESESSGRRAVMLAPNLAVSYRTLAIVLQCQGKIAEAVAAYRKAILLQPDYPDHHYLLGNALMATGDLPEAEMHLRRAIDLRPNFFEALSDLGALLLTMGHVDEAAVILQHALALRPDSPEVLANLANVLEMDDHVDEALKLYQRALHSQPDSLDVLGKQVELLERSGRLEAAQEILNQGMTLNPDHPLLNLVAARLDRRAGCYEKAAKRLEAILAHPMPHDLSGEVHLLLGQMYDRLGRNEEVLCHLIEGNRRTACDPSGSGRKRFMEKIATARTWLPDSLPSTEQASQEDVTEAPIFLIGFPRSGTTLLEQVLDSHPALQTMEEKPAAAAMERAFLAMTRGTTNGLSKLDNNQIETLRQTYFEEVGRHLKHQPGIRLVDKLPLNIVRVPLLWRIFPEARFILAIRHPCDVTLSCLMQSFGKNDAMAGFTSLEGIAEIYVQVMVAWKEYVTCLPLHWHRMRYEDLIDNFESEVRALLEFLEIKWDDGVLNHTQHARQRGIIQTPSYHQVTQPIYQHAKHRWKRYDKEFTSVIDVLQPFIEHFGYEEL